MENTLENAYEFLSELSDAAPKMSLPEALVAYATAVRPVVVLPSDVNGYDRHLDATIECTGCDYRHSRRHRVYVPINSTMKESRCPKCGEPSFFDVVLELEDKIEKSEKKRAKLLRASSITAPVPCQNVVRVPKYYLKPYLDNGCDERGGGISESETDKMKHENRIWESCISALKSLNPDLTFTSPAPTCDKADGE